MSAGAFEAWCLPGGVDPPGLAEPSEGGESSFRLLAIDPDWLDGLIDALANAREGLRGLGAAQLAKVLGQAGSRFMDDDDPLRQEALDRLPATSGLSAEMCRTVLDGMAANWSEGRLTTLLVDELGGPQPLDGFVDQGGPQTMAVGARLCVQIASGSVPGVGVDALIRSLLTKAPTLLKPGLGDVVLPVLFARALKEVDPSVAAGLAVVYWPGGDGALERTALTRADLVTIYGSDETVRGLRALAPVTARLVVYHHRTSVGVVGRAALAARVAGATASDIANAVALFDQRGCVSPQVIWVDGPRGWAAWAAARNRRADGGVGSRRGPAPWRSGLLDRRTGSRRRPGGVLYWPRREGGANRLGVGPAGPSRPLRATPSDGGRCRTRRSARRTGGETRQCRRDTHRAFQRRAIPDCVVASRRRGSTEGPAAVGRPGGWLLAPVHRSLDDR